MLCKASSGFNAVHIKIAMAYFPDLEQIVQQFIWNQNQPQIASAILRKKNEVEGNHRT